MTDNSKITPIDVGRKLVEQKQSAQKQTDKKPTIGRHGANGKIDAGYERALRKQKAGGVGGIFSSRGGGIKWYHYLQFVALLVLVSWLMKSCSGG